MFTMDYFKDDGGYNAWGYNSSMWTNDPAKVTSNMIWWQRYYSIQKYMKKNKNQYDYDGHKTSMSQIMEAYEEYRS